jgi:CheY-like chemotaxis protein
MDDGTGRNAVEVLLVEDDHGDVVMITEAFEQSGAPVRLHVVGDGDQAMQFLRRAEGFAEVPRPGLIVLDLNLPRRSAYVAKPADFDGFTDAIRQIARWFLELIELPRPS